MRHLNAVFGILSNKRRHRLHTADVNVSCKNGGNKLIQRVVDKQKGPQRTSAKKPKTGFVISRSGVRSRRVAPENFLKTQYFEEPARLKNHRFCPNCVRTLHATLPMSEHLCRRRGKHRYRPPAWMFRWQRDAGASTGDWPYVQTWPIRPFAKPYPEPAHVDLIPCQSMPG